MKGKITVEETRLNTHSYGLLFTFLQILKFTTPEDRETVFKLLDLYKTSLDKALALLDKLLESVGKEKTEEQLRSELAAAAASETFDAGLKFYEL